MTRHALAREITVALIFKAIVLAFLYFAFFAPHHRIIVTPERAAERLFVEWMNGKAQ